ncbi:unnamed protein product [Moneuplotes crassus]|uniref:THH1/TOM1/TOM3 domain-containing protein n=1 Tax=Euplotes crassus TaxID=5936 RepID=A0AAD1UHC0_EUPCR|nr:unnamed protein product [Moneuplotes crassus]
MLISLFTLQDEESDTCVYYKIYLGIILFISCGIMAFTIWRTVKFYLRFRCTKKLILIFLLVVCASTVGRVLYFIFEFLWRTGECSMPYNTCAESLMHWLSATLFAIAVVINIFNWIYQTIKMKVFQEGKYKDQTAVHLVFGIFVLVVFLTYIGFVTSSCIFEDSADVIFNIVTLVYAGTFFIIGLTFIIVGINFYRKYKQFNIDQATKIRTRIIMSISVISISFITRGTLNILYYIFDKNARLRREWLKSNSLWFPIIMTAYFIVAEILPTLYLCLGLKVASNQASKKEIFSEDIDTSLSIDRFTVMNINEQMHSEGSIETETSFGWKDKT